MLRVLPHAQPFSVPPSGMGRLPRSVVGSLQQLGNAPRWLSDFKGSADTLERMRHHVWGARGEKSLKVRSVMEQVVRDVFPKDYLGEIEAIRNWCTINLRYTNDPLHVEWIKDPERLIDEYLAYGRAIADCDEIAQLVATMALQLGRRAEFVAVGFGAQGAYSHVFARVQEPKTGQWIVCDPVAGTDEARMLQRVKTFELWSLDP